MCRARLDRLLEVLGHPGGQRDGAGVVPSQVSGYGGQLNLGQAAFYGIGAYTITIGAAKTGLDPIACFILAPIVTAAIARYGDVRQATRSQYWMLAVMITFTCLGLWLLSAAAQ